jgi:GNAT superfamily N-acetyltransferase
MTVRPAVQAENDIQAIVHHRAAMFRDMGYADESAIERMSVRFEPWLETKMDAGEYLGWFALAPDGAIVAGLGLWLMDWLPHMLAGGRWRGNIVNVYTEPAHRRQGLARGLMQIALEWCSANGVEAVILHASPEGRTLYESLGFTPTNEMRLIRTAK